MNVHPELVDVLAALPEFDPLADPQATRALLRSVLAAASPVADPRLTIEDSSIPGPIGDLGIRIYRPTAGADSPRPAVLYFHGGAFISGDLDTGDANCRDQPSITAITDPRVIDGRAVSGMWPLYLGSGPADQYAAPARAADLAGLPPAYLEICEQDALRDQALDYARRLILAGVSTEIHHVPGAFHLFEGYAPASALATGSGKQSEMTSDE